MRIELYRETEFEYDTGDTSPATGSHPGDYRWRIWESSDVIGASTEGYKDRRDMIHNLLHVTGGRLKRVRDKLVLERRNVQRGRLVRHPVKDMTGDDE